jgi:alkylresorcinol/alkylpyrone synthase
MLEDILKSEDAKPGDYGVMIAMGPGFSVELVLFEW